MNRHNRRALKKEPRYRVVLELEGGIVQPYGPAAPRDFCERVCEGINRGLIAGKRSPNNTTGAGIVPVAMN